MRVIKKIFLLLLFSIFYSQLYSQDNIHDFLERLSKGNYVIDFYCDVLKSGKRETIHKFSDVYIDREYPDPDYGKVKYKWYDMEMFSMDSIDIRIDDDTNKIDDEYFEISFHGLYIESSSLDKTIEIQFRESVNDEFSDSFSSLNWKLVRKNKVNIFYFRFDGDYLYIYLNGETDKDLFATFVNMNDETFSQFKSLIANNKCDLSKVTWPRHADGSCDYDGSKSTSTNITPDKLMSVTENLKLRSSEATTSKVLAVMAAGTKVKVLELGKAETIDGITSNWVKVEVQKGAKDRDGKTIKKGTVGWCYGGYLEEVEEVLSDNQSNQKLGLEENIFNKDYIFSYYFQGFFDNEDSGDFRFQFDYEEYWKEYEASYGTEDYSSNKDGEWGYTEQEPSEPHYWKKYYNFIVIHFYEDKIQFGSNCFGRTDLIAIPDTFEIIEDNILKYHILNIKKEDEELYVNSQYFPLYEKQTPFNLLIKKDGDYLKLYLDWSNPLK